MYDWILVSIIFIFPAYVANAAPVLFGGGPPIDNGKKLGDGKRILGDGKTWRGLAAGVLSGVLIGAYLALITPLELSHFTTVENRVIASILLAAGAMAGDLAGSFIKRRMGLARGQQSLFLDQLGFLYTALLLTLPLYTPNLQELLFLTILTMAMHLLTNRIANFLRLKNVPW